MSRSKNRSDWDKYRPGDESDDRTANSASRSRDNRRRDATPVRRDSREDSPVRQDSAARDSRLQSSTRDTRDARDQPFTRDQSSCRDPKHATLLGVYETKLKAMELAIETREAHIKNLVEAKNGMKDANKRLDDANKGLYETNKSLLERLAAAMDQNFASEQQRIVQMNRQLYAHCNMIKDLEDKAKAHEARLKVLQHSNKLLLQDSNKLLEEYCFRDAEEAEVPHEALQAPAQRANKNKAEKES